MNNAFDKRLLAFEDFSAGSFLQLTEEHLDDLRVVSKGK